MARVEKVGLAALAGLGAGAAVRVAGDVIAPGIEPIAPTADFVFTPANPAVGETVSFDASSSCDPRITAFQRGPLRL